MVHSLSVSYLQSWFLLLTSEHGHVYPFTGLMHACLINLHLKFTSAKTPWSASLFSSIYSFLILSPISMRTFLSVILMFLFLFCLVMTCYHTAFATWLNVTYVLIIKELAAAAAAKLLQSCPTLCDPTDGSPPGSSVHGILQARTLEWVAISFSSAWKWKVKLKSFSCVQLFVTSWTVAYQAPPSMGFSRQEYWSGVSFPSPEVLAKYP